MEFYQHASQRPVALIDRYSVNHFQLFPCLDNWQITLSQNLPELMRPRRQKMWCQNVFQYFFGMVLKGIKTI